MLRPQIRDSIDRMDKIGTCWQAVSDILIPNKQLDETSCDRLSCLLDFLSDEYVQASEKLHLSLKQQS